MLKIALFASAILLLVLVLPKEGRFRYEFSKGKPWLHDDLYAPFDFAIIKYDHELKEEQERVTAGLKPYFSLDTNAYLEQRPLMINDFEIRWEGRFMHGGEARISKEAMFRQALAVF